jgi:hypothetical protein
MIVSGNTTLPKKYKAPLQFPTHADRETLTIVLPISDAKPLVEVLPPIRNRQRLSLNPES